MRWLALGLIFLASAAAARTLRGTVVDSTGGPVAQATVVLTQGARQRTTSADRVGGFAFDEVAPGGWALLATYGAASVRLEGNGDGPVALRLEVTPEEIRIHESAPVVVTPRAVRATVPRRWAYSDELTDRNDYAVVWVLARIGADGRVAGARILKSPGLGLDEIALATVKRMRFEPARDAGGRAAAYEGVLVLEWPPYWGGGTSPTCKGTGPLNLDQTTPAYRDCEPPEGYEQLKLGPLRNEGGGHRPAPPVTGRPWPGGQASPRRNP